MQEFKCCDVKHIRLEARSGANVGACLQEALMLAATENVVVVLEHKGGDYKVDPADLRAAVKVPQRPREVPQ